MIHNSAGRSYSPHLNILGMSDCRGATRGIPDNRGTRSHRSASMSPCLPLSIWDSRDNPKVLVKSSKFQTETRPNRGILAAAQAAAVIPLPECFVETPAKKPIFAPAKRFAHAHENRRQHSEVMLPASTTVSSGESPGLPQRKWRVS